MLCWECCEEGHSRETAGSREEVTNVMSEKGRKEERKEESSRQE
jgi:hypothetical protein